MISKIEKYPIPLEQEELQERLESIGYFSEEYSDVSVDEAHSIFKDVIAKNNDWEVFHLRFPFGSHRVVLWNNGIGEGISIDRGCGEWHSIVNLFAEVVEEEGDCRDAEYSSSLMPSGTYDQRCKKCGDSWSV